MAYPEERVKGRWRAFQWCFIMAGSSVGGIIALSITWNTGREGVSNALCIIFITLQCCAVVLCFLVRHPMHLRRSDGTELAEFRHLSVKESLAYSGRLLTDWRIICLVPAMFAPEMFFPLQSHINGYAFSLRTARAEQFSEQRRALFAIALDVVWITGAYIAQTVWLASWKFRLSVPGPDIDVTDSAYAGAIVIYIFFAAQYSLFQNVVIYVLGAITNDPRKAAALSGLLVGLQSSGTAVSFGVTATAKPLMNQNIAYFALTTICWPLLAFVVWKGVTVTTYTIEAAEGVIPPVKIAQELHIDKSVEVDIAPSTVGDLKS
ncbi:hypothetical protein CLAIMM_07500 [Cladophialophora immunda]|nr:hypothetical protein CLAIMM_07500 [Cladophialophora immunda]